MPINPTIPVDGTPMVAAEMRSQFQALEADIATIPVGPPGPQGPTGPQGPPFAAAVVDGTGTLPPGNSASVSAFFDGTNVHFNFDIPQGAPGEVTLADLNNAISNVLANASNSSNGVALLLPAIPAPTLMDVAQKLDELIQALRR